MRTFPDYLLSHCAHFVAAGLLLSACLGAEPADGSAENIEGAPTFSGALTEHANGLTLDHVLMQFTCSIEYMTSLQVAEPVRMQSVAELFEVSAGQALMTLTRADLQADDATLGDTIADIMQDLASRAGPRMPWFKFEVACTDVKAL